MGKSVGVAEVVSSQTDTMYTIAAVYSSLSLSRTREEEVSKKLVEIRSQRTRPRVVWALR